MINHGKELWLDSTTMMNRGIATGIIIAGEYFDAEDYKLKYNKKGEIRKKRLKGENKRIAEIEAEEQLLKMQHQEMLQMQETSQGE